MSAHPEVAAYALGLMEPEEARRFEAHLLGCDACAVELEELLPVAHLLADVDPEDVLGEPDATGGIRLPGPPSGPILVGFEDPPRLAAVPDDPAPPSVPRPAGRRSGRRSGAEGPPRRRVPLAVAAGIAGLAIGAGAVAGTGMLRDDTGATQAGPAPTATPEADAVLSATGETGVHADVALTDKAWGTLVSFTISDIEGPRECRLVAEKRDGSTEVLSSWLIPERGYGGGTTPAALSLTAATSLHRDDIRAFRVQETGGPDDVNAGPVLVTVEA